MESESILCFFLKPCIIQDLHCKYVIPGAAGSQDATSVSSSPPRGEEAVEVVCSSSTSGPRLAVLQRCKWAMGTRGPGSPVLFPHADRGPCIPMLGIVDGEGSFWTVVKEDSAVLQCAFWEWS